MIAYDYSLYKILSQVYPEYNWLPWRFDLDFWKDMSDSTMFVEWVGKKLGIKELSDWYNVNIEVNTVTIATIYQCKANNRPWRCLSFNKTSHYFSFTLCDISYIFLGHKPIPRSRYMD